MSASTEIMEIDAEKLRRMLMLHVHFLLFDLRSAEDYAQGHIKGALHIPSNEFLQKLPQMVPQKDTPVVIYDQDGTGSASFVALAEKAGYLNIVNLEGGYSAFVEKNKPNFRTTP